MRTFDQILQDSKTQPALILKYMPRHPESEAIKKSLEKSWTIPDDQLKVYLLDVNNKSISNEITQLAGVENHYPQILLFADGVTMYDESYDLINIKKIVIALKIINRTFRWMETRV
ncbi:MAG: monothiol bacilliredoxin BrxC family protein [Bacteroidota bacterium]